MTIFRPGRPVRLPAVTVAVAALVATTLAASSNATARELGHARRANRRHQTR